MLCYKDKSYCSQATECAKAKKCDRFITVEEKKRAAEMKIPVSYSNFEDCFVKKV